MLEGDILQDDDRMLGGVFFQECLEMSNGTIIFVPAFLKNFMYLEVWRTC